MRILLLACLLSSSAFAAPEAAPKNAKPAAKAAPTAAAPAGDAAGKAPLLARFEKTCLTTAAGEGRDQKELCGCLKFNLGSKLSPEQLSLLVRFYEGDAAAKETLQKPRFANILDFDMRATDGCQDDKSFRAADGPLPPDANDQEGEETVEAEKIQETMKDPEKAKKVPEHKAAAVKEKAKKASEPK